MLNNGRSRKANLRNSFRYNWGKQDISIDSWMVILSCTPMGPSRNDIGFERKKKWGAFSQ